MAWKVPLSPPACMVFVAPIKLHASASLIVLSECRALLGLTFCNQLTDADPEWVSPRQEEPNRGCAVRIECLPCFCVVIAQLLRNGPQGRI